VFAQRKPLSEKDTAPPAATGGAGNPEKLPYPHLGPLIQIPSPSMDF
jgi:hypothetical protein